MSRIEQALLRALESEDVRDVESGIPDRGPRASRSDPRLRLVSTGHPRDAVRPALSGVEGPAVENPYVRRALAPALTPRLSAPEVEFARTRPLPTAPIVDFGSGSRRPVVEAAAAWEMVLEQASALAAQRSPLVAPAVDAVLQQAGALARVPAPVVKAVPAPVTVVVPVATPPPAPATEQGFTWLPVQSPTQAGNIAMANPIAVEQFRKLAGQVIRAQETHGVKVVTVTSALQGEGKSFTSSALATTLANSYKRDVLLVDADMRLPALQTLFQLPTGWGLSELLDQARADQISPYQVSPMLAVLAAGRPNRDPVGALTSARMREFIEAASAKYDFVILDTPPVAVLPDANLLGSMVDAVLLVIKAGETQYEYMNRAVEAIKKERILGVVLNRAEQGLALKAYEYSKY
ncbi:MAG: CpsD/CapB family tyrosine-protein kinase [Acidobacteria bacterium]|nr:CpsD/CapB family tyrosine-protein kinase [Acidobacteriota bacterium]